MLPPLALVVAFRETGWRRPLRDPTLLEIWTADTAELVGTLPASVLAELIRAHLSVGAVQARLATYVAAPVPPRKPLAPAPPRLRRPPGRRREQSQGRDVRGGETRL
jgi:hypothetical protein